MGAKTTLAHKMDTKHSRKQRTVVQGLETNDTLGVTAIAGAAAVAAGAAFIADSQLRLSLDMKFFMRMVSASI